MLWKIDIEQYGTENVITSFCSRKVGEVLQWWNDNWAKDFVADKVNFSVYANGKQLTFDQAFDLGFYDIMKNKK